MLIDFSLWFSLHWGDSTLHQFLVLNHIYPTRVWSAWPAPCYPAEHVSVWSSIHKGHYCYKGNEKISVRCLFQYEAKVINSKMILINKAVIIIEVLSVYCAVFSYWWRTLCLSCSLFPFLLTNTNKCKILINVETIPPVFSRGRLGSKNSVFLSINQFEIKGFCSTFLFKD